MIRDRQIKGGAWAADRGRWHCPELQMFRVGKGIGLVVYQEQPITRAVAYDEYVGTHHTLRQVRL